MMFLRKLKIEQTKYCAIPNIFYPIWQGSVLSQHSLKMALGCGFSGQSKESMLIINGIVAISCLLCLLSSTSLASRLVVLWCLPAKKLILHVEGYLELFYCKPLPTKCLLICNSSCEVWHYLVAFSYYLQNHVKKQKVCLPVSLLWILQTSPRHTCS